MSTPTQQTINSLLHYFYAIFLPFNSFKKHFQSISVVKDLKILFSSMVKAICDFFACHSDHHYLNKIHILINTQQQIFMFKVSIFINFLWKIWLN